MPYRESPRDTGPMPGDPPLVVKAYENLDRFGRLQPTSLWSAPAERPFEGLTLNKLAVSTDGAVALVCSGSRAWLLDTMLLKVSKSIKLPESPDLVALSADGSRAIVLCSGSLYRWDETSDELEVVWRSEGLKEADVLRLSADGRIAIAANQYEKTLVRVFDVGELTITHSVRADANECLLLPKKMTKAGRGSGQAVGTPDALGKEQYVSTSFTAGSGRESRAHAGRWRSYGMDLQSYGNADI